MPSNPPVDFQAKAQGATGATGRDYPYAIKAKDLMQNFVFATLDIEENLYLESTGVGGHRQRKLKIKAGTANNQILFWDGSEYVPLVAPPGSGTHVLGVVNGAIQWIETEECE